MKFPRNLKVPIRNHLTSRGYSLIPAGNLRPEPAILAQIVSICNEPAVYHWLFQDPLKCEPYPEQKAREWLERSNQEWSQETHFVFAVVDENGEVTAACDIKSNSEIAEIGYWASQHHRGVMTNAVKAMCALAQQAGYKGLFARTKIGNTLSQAVLKRVGFTPAPSDSDQRLYFTLQFTS